MTTRSLGPFLRGVRPNPAEVFAVHDRWTRLTEAQAAVYDAAVRGRRVVDLGAGKGGLSRRAREAGAASVVAVEPSEDWGPWDVRGVPRLREDAAAFLARDPDFDVLVLGWPPAHPVPGLDALVDRAPRVVYAGQCTRGSATGTLPLWRKLAARAVWAYLPSLRSTLIVYDGPLSAPRAPLHEERAGLDPWTIYGDADEATDPPVRPDLRRLTARELQALYRRERAAFAARYPGPHVARAPLVVVDEACGASGRCGFRDVAWAQCDPGRAGRVSILARALRDLTPEQLLGVVRHELGHLADPTPDAPEAEARAAYRRQVKGAAGG